MNSKLLYLFYLFTFIFLLEATATIRYVSKTGSSTPPYTSWATASDSIQKCINYSLAGDTIYVGNGVYKEKIVVNNKFLILIGSDWDSCIIDAREFETFSDFYAIIVVGNIIIKNFYIKVSTQHWGSGFLLEYCNVSSVIEFNRVENCNYGTIIYNSLLTFKNNLITDTDTGIRTDVVGNYTPIIDSNVIVTFYDYSVGIHDIALSTIRNNYVISEEGGSGYFIITPREIRNNTSLKNYSYGKADYFLSLGEGVIANNFSIGKPGSQGMHLFRGRNTVRNNNIIGGEDGYKIELPYAINFKYNNSWNTNSPFLGFTSDSTNITVNPMFVNEDSSDFHLQMFSPLIDAGDPNILDRDGSRSDIGVFGGPYGEKYTYRDLAPKPPKNVTAVYANKVVKLKWNRNTEADFSHYRIYRDTVPHFIYDTTKIVGVTSDTTFSDNLPISTTAQNYYYLLTALDSTNHQSAPSEEVMVIVTGMNEVPPIVAEEYKLLNNYPNPFNSSTIIPYRLKEGGYVKLIIYNTMGEAVRVLVNEYQAKGYYEAEFSPSAGERQMGEMGIEYPTGYNDDIASGLYIYSLKVRGDGDIPVFTSMGKMILLK